MAKYDKKALEEKRRQRIADADAIGKQLAPLRRDMLAEAKRLRGEGVITESVALASMLLDDEAYVIVFGEKRHPDD